LKNYPRLVAQSETFFQRWGPGRVLCAVRAADRAFVPVTAGALGMSPPRFYASTFRRSCYGPAHVLPGVLAISALHQYGGFPVQRLKHYWMLAVVAGALLAWLAYGRSALAATAAQPAKPAN